MFGIADNNGDTDTHKFVYLPVKNQTTGRTWLNNNLGAQYADMKSESFRPAQQATASEDYKAFGSLFQWGRKADGHELINWKNGSKGVGKAKEIAKNNDAPVDASFIIQGSGSNDWRVTRDDTLWENEASANNVCPIGYRLPTGGDNGQRKEWEVEVESWNSRTSDGALASTLKLPLSGVRNPTKGGLMLQGAFGNYWSANVADSTSRAYNLSLLSSNSGLSVVSDSNHKAYGFSVRCIKKADDAMG
jgi:uncharacterized protein (TIGR02145 family)